MPTSGGTIEIIAVLELSIFIVGLVGSSQFSKLASHTSKSSVPKAGDDEVQVKTRGSPLASYVHATTSKLTSYGKSKSLGATIGAHASIVVVAGVQANPSTSKQFGSPDESVPSQSISSQ